MAEPVSPAKLFRTWPQWAALGTTVCLGLAMFAFVDLTPRIEADFFFANDDPQLQDSRLIEAEFGQAPQVFVAARSAAVVSAAYLRRLHALTEDLRNLSGVADVRSVTRGPKDPEDILRDEPREVFEDLDDGPFWRRLLVAPDRSATFIILRLASDAGQPTIEAIDGVLAAHGQPDFMLGATGVPYVSEHIRARLSSDLRRFSLAAILAFGVLVGLLFRSVAVLIGTMVAALAACFGTFLVRTALGMQSDILMPNLWTIAFVLTLSHVVYLTAAWQRQSRRSSDPQAVGDAVRLTGPASAWSLAANLLGFASLMLVSARPLRQFGISGVIAAGLAIAAAYLLFPPFLRAARAPSPRTDATTGAFAAFVQRKHPWIAVSVVAMAIVLAPMAWRVETDPALPTYFGASDPIRIGLESVDRAGGSSPLEIVVADPSNRTFANGDMVDRLQALERAIERHPDVGAVLSIASLMGEAERPWYAFLFSWETRLDHLDGPKQERVGRTFLSADRRKARFILRMHEHARTRPRSEVIGDITATIEKHGFRPVIVGGLYPLQGELSRLVEGSVVRGLGGLLAAFFVMVLIVTRAWRTAFVMTICLATTPLLLFGIVALARMPLDIISAPAANVALPMGIDEMIHLGYAVRRRGEGNRGASSAWREALADLWRPILFSMIVVASGFALFLLSSFPPTQRLGMLVCAGAILTDLVVLLVLPTMASGRLGLQARRT